MVVQLESDVEADPSLTNGIFPPVYDGLIGYFEFQDTIDRARLNLVDASLATVVGSPVVAADGVTFTGGTNYLTSLLAEPRELTFITVAKALTSVANTAAGRVPLIGNYTNVGGANLWVGPRNGGSPAHPAGATSGAAFTTAGIPTTLYANEADVTNWACRSLRAWESAGTTYSKVNQLTEGTSHQLTYPYLRQMLATTLRIGSFDGTFGTGQAKMLRLAVYNRALSDGDLATMHAWIAAQAAAVNPLIVV